MATFSLWAAFGLCLLKLCLTETEFNVSCRYGGVFHVEKNGRYSLTRSEAVELCRALNSTLATLEQLKKAHELGFETCRYGFVVGHIVIPRINPYHLCAANNTGIYKLSANTTARYDAYCYNETETADKTCEPVVKIDTSLLSNQDETVIDNADGSRYNADGTRHTGGESSTSGGDEENAGSGSTHETTAMDASIRRSSPSYYGSPTPVSQLPDHTSGGGEKGMPGKDYDDEFPSVSPDISLGTVAGDFHEDDGQYPASPITVSTDILAPEDTTQEAWAPHPVATAASSPDGAHHQEPTQTPVPWGDEPGQGTEGITNPMETPRDEVLHRTTASVTQTVIESVDDAEQGKATKEPLAPGTAPGGEGEPANTTDGFHGYGMPGVFSDIEDRFVPLQDPLTTSSSVYGDQGPHKGHYESTTIPGETATTKIASQPRSAPVPDWLIIVVALVVLALILAVCIAVNARRRCGQKQKLVINNGKGAVEDRKTSELNGDISKSQEMVHLVHKEQSNDRTEACDEFLTVNETQNHHEFDMKTGV
ncbi:PREDICTED: CD44 antigen isoform X6 [Ficedula albicollis]|uniref:CD44 antigen isoform X6 n=1 Tax=Ficedula albicollis TaxID=59894 RepID=UPI0007AD96A2|nr:PREDICTED: CD44 antigen isoform X6 [Ficedula albicollis]